MKLSKTLASFIGATSSLAVLVPSSIVLTSCGKDIKIDVEGVDVKTSTDSDGNTVCTLSKKESLSDKSIYDVEVKIGEQKLKVNEEYKVSGLVSNSNEQEVVVTILKATFEKYSGKVVITPKLVNNTPTGINVSYAGPFSRTETIKAQHVSIYYTYEGGIIGKTKLVWGTQYKIYDVTGTKTEITNFSTNGFKFENKQTYKFQVETLGTKTFTSNFDVEVQPMKVFITCNVAEADKDKVEMTTASIQTNEEQKWGYIKSLLPKPKAKIGYLMTGDWVKEDGETINDETLLNEGFTAHPTTTTIPSEKKYTEACTEKSNISGYGFENAYVPSKCNDSSHKMECGANTEYTFTIDCTSLACSIKYFWIADRTDDSNKLVKFRESATKNYYFVNCKYKADEGSQEQSIGFSYISYNNGQYLQFDNPYTAGTLMVTVKFDKLREIIPVFE